ncbi:MAG: diphosphate--fructose-6-phosphate 1-phosphotransferase [Armatimonadota bacterium]
MSISELDRARAAYQPKLPRVLTEGTFHLEEDPTDAPHTFADEIRKEFPNTIGKPLLRLMPGAGELSDEPLTVGVVLSGGPAPGGHNVVAGLLDALKKANPASRLIGFLDGPIGVIKNRYIELTPEAVEPYRNTGGFDLLGSGRDKIEKPEEMEACRRNLSGLGAHGLVIIGGDDSNTNAAVLAEYFKANAVPVSVIGVPKTIDGDMRNDYIEASFGFDTASKVFAEIVGSICRDSMSSRKYWHFVRLMGRAASHITLEVALQTRPNLAIISEEAEAKGWTLKDVVDQIVAVVKRRAEAGKSYGVVVIPEGLLEFLVDVKAMIAELGIILGEHEGYLKSLTSHEDRRQFLTEKLSAESAQVYNSLPDGIQEVLLLRDKHGNIPLSQVETEKLLIDLVSDRIREMKAEGQFQGSFSPLSHFFGYEGRCVQPSNFDADYCYTLGYTAAQLIRGGVTGYTVSARNLTAPASEWVMGGVPVTSMLTVEMRKGKPKPVIRKTLVSVDGKPFLAFAAERDSWVEEDCFAYPGPIQYFGPSEVCDRLTKTLVLEHS